MTKNKNRRNGTVTSTPFEQARDELLQHIIRCGVLEAATEHQIEWFGDTMGYLAERYPELSKSEIAELQTLGLRFCQPPKSKTPTAAIDDTASAA